MLYLPLAIVPRVQMLIGFLRGPNGVVLSLSRLKLDFAAPPLAAGFGPSDQVRSIEWRRSAVNFHGDLHTAPTDRLYTVHSMVMFCIEPGLRADQIRLQYINFLLPTILRITPTVPQEISLQRENLTIL